MPVKSWKRSQVIGTRDHLVETAARLFAKQGYGDTSLVQVVAEAGLTRGAVYHHFADKRDLFRAVLDWVLRELVYGVEKRAVKRAAATGGEDAGETLRLLVEELASPAAQRIVSIDGPAALGEAEWRGLLEAQLLAPIRRVLQPAVEAGRIDAALVPALARLLFGAVRETDASDPAQEQALRLLVQRLVG